MYADDLCLYRPIPSQHDLFILQKDMDMLVAAINNLALNLNAGKCKTITFSRKESPLSFAINILGTQLDQVSSLKYLGSYLTNDLRGPNTLLLSVLRPGKSWAISIESLKNSHMIAPPFLYFIKLLFDQSSNMVPLSGIPTSLKIYRLLNQSKGLQPKYV